MYVLNTIVALKLMDLNLTLNLLKHYILDEENLIQTLKMSDVVQTRNSSKEKEKKSER